MNTSSSALGVSDGGVIVGTGVLNGLMHAYAMVLVATNVTVGGRILNASGRPIRNAIVSITGGNLPAGLKVQTGSLAWYAFSGLQSGLTYTISVAATRNTFAQTSRMITPQADVANFDFTAEQ